MLAAASTKANGTPTCSTATPARAAPPGAGGVGDRPHPREGFVDHFPLGRFEPRGRLCPIAKGLGVHEGTLGNWVNKDRRAREGGSGRLSEGDLVELGAVASRERGIGMGVMSSSVRWPSGPRTRWACKRGRVHRLPAARVRDPARGGMQRPAPTAREAANGDQRYARSTKFTSLRFRGLPAGDLRSHAYCLNGQACVRFVPARWAWVPAHRGATVASY